MWRPNEGMLFNVSELSCLEAKRTCPEEGGQLDTKERQREQVHKGADDENVQNLNGCMVPLLRPRGKNIKICIVVGAFKPQGGGIEGE